MTNWKELEKQFAARLALDRRPVAVTFLDAEPSGVPKFSGTEPAGCSFWRLAAAGRTFYTVPADHFNCAVGAYTHNVQLPPDRVQETETMLGMMFNLGYVRPEEIPGIPRLAKEPAAVVFAPLADAPMSTQASCCLRARLPRPCCLTKLPFAQEPAASCRCSAGRRAWRFPRRLRMELFPRSAASGIACTPISARTKCTLSCPARKLEAVSDALGIITTANATLEEFARGRQASLSTV